ncbi:unnamed protein product, partial [Mesorhabditis spiculigera]
MHAVIERVLRHKHLQSSSQLFALSDYDVISDLHTVFGLIKEILHERGYGSRKEDQSVVELVLARILNAIRETSSIETYCAQLVDLLDCCLQYPMSIRSTEKISSHGNETYCDSAHCKVAVEILSSLFMYYSKKPVMTLAIPVALRALSSNNADLSRNVISYISLSAVHCERVLAQYAIQIAGHIVGGKHALLKVLPQIYAENKEALHAHLPQLMRLLDQNVALEDKRSLLQFASRVAASNAELLIPYLPRLTQFLNKPATCLPVLHIYQPLCAQGKAHLLTETILSLEEATEDPVLKSLATVSPDSLRPYGARIESIAKTSPSVRSLCSRLLEMANAPRPDKITVIPIRNDNSSDSLLSRKDRSRYDSSTLGSRSRYTGGESSTAQTVDELDRNTESLAQVYQNRSNSSLSKYKSRSYVSVTAGQSQNSASETAYNSRDLSMASIPGPSTRPPDYSSLKRKPPPPQATQQNKAQTLPTTFAPTQIQVSHPVSINSLALFPKVIEEEMISEEPAEPWQDTKSIDRGDVVRQFVDHRRSKIRRYVEEVSSRMPIPVQCTVEGGKGKHRMRIHFSCQVRSTYCIFHADNLYGMKTKSPSLWLHLMFLQMESSSLTQTGQVLCQSSGAYRTLANCWSCLPSAVTKGRPFVTLVTSAFPPQKEQEKLARELDENALWEFFQLDAVTSKWACLSCAHPDRVRTFVEEKMLCGELKEKRGRWKFLRRWHTKFFTLSTASLTYTTGMPSSGEVVRQNNHFESPSIDLRTIRVVRSLSRGNKKRKSLRKAFEICTQENKSYVLKATDERKAEEWLQCLQVAIANARRDDPTHTL